MDDDWPEVDALAGVDPLVDEPEDEPEDEEESEELVDFDSLESEPEPEDELEESDESVDGAPERLSVR